MLARVPGPSAKIMEIYVKRNAAAPAKSSNDASSKTNHTQSFRIGNQLDIIQQVSFIDPALP
jgi:hypothetical protein